MRLPETLFGQPPVAQRPLNGRRTARHNPAPKEWAPWARFFRRPTGHPPKSPLADSLGRRECDLHGNDPAAAPRRVAQAYFNGRTDGLQLSTARAFDRRAEGAQADTSPLLALDVDCAEHGYLLSASWGGVVDLYAVGEADVDVTGAAPAIVAPLARINRTSAAGRGGHSRAVTDVQWSPFHTGLFVTGCMDARVRAWDPNDLSRATHEFQVRTQVHAVHLSPVLAAARELVAAALADGSVRLCDLRSRGSAHTLQCHAAATLAIRWSPADPNVFASASADGTVKMWDVRRAQACLAALDARGTDAGRAHHGAATGLVFSPSGSHLYTAGRDHQIRRWDAHAYRITLVNFGTAFVAGDAAAPLRIAAFGGCGDQASAGPLLPPRLAVPSASGAILVFDPRTGATVSTLDAHFAPPLCVAARVDPDAAAVELFSSGRDGLLVNWVPGALDLERRRRFTVSSSGFDPALCDEWSDDSSV